MDLLKEFFNKTEDGERWITVHPHGHNEENDDYRRIKVHAGETSKEACDRVFKGKTKEETKKPQEKDFADMSQDELKAKKKQLWTDLMNKYKGLKNIKEIPIEERRKYLEDVKKIDELLGKKPKEEEKKPEDKKPIEKQIETKEDSPFKAYREKQKEVDELNKEWHELGEIAKDKLEKNKKYKDLEAEHIELKKKRMSLSYTSPEYKDVQKRVDEIYKEKDDIRKEAYKKAYDMQHLVMEEEDKLKSIREDIIKKQSGTIKDRLKAISKDNDKLVNDIKALIPKEYYDLKKEADKDQEEYLKVDHEYNLTGFYSTERVVKRRELKEAREKRDVIFTKVESYNKDMPSKISKLLQVNNGVKLNLDADTPAMQENAKRLEEVLNGVIPDTVYPNKTMKLRACSGARASQYGSTISVTKNEKIGTLIHETMHNVEEHNPEVLMNSLAFAESRTQGEKQLSLRKITGASYRADEHCKKDKFFNPYCGKIYDAFGGKKKSYLVANASEVMSMGVQKLFTDPINFIESDREYFDFVIANLRGTLWG